MNVLLVQPYTFTIRGLPQVPLAVMYVGGEAERKGHRVKILDRNLETNARKIIEDFKPDILGVTSLTGAMILDGLKISRYVRCRFPAAKIIWGGIHTSILPEQSLIEPSVDYVVVGEGEESFGELLDAIENKKDVSKIPGIGYKDVNLKPVINERRPSMADLDSISLVPWHLIDPKRYVTYETLFISSRGCPHRCSFCYNEKFNFRRWRGMSPERVKKEIDHAQSFHPVRRFRFDDDNFCVDKKRLYAILDFLPKNVPLYFESRIEYIDDEFCRRLSEFRDAFVFIGIESGDNEVLSRMRKDLTVEQIRHGYDLINKYRINTSASFVIGTPGETREQLSKTLNLIDDIKPTRPSCCIFVPFPGSIFTETLIAEGKLMAFNTLEDWGRFSNGEYAKDHQYGETPVKELNRIYQRYWRRFVIAFAVRLRFKWIVIGAVNGLKNYCRTLIKSCNGDL
jgi:anaerobic magnesium-protoporphyrin IX monomethyl ester cyclase